MNALEQLINVTVKESWTPEMEELGIQARAELAQMTAVIEAARLQNSVWHSPAVAAALAALEVTK